MNFALIFSLKIDFRSNFRIGNQGSGYNKNHRNYINKMITKINKNSPNSILGGLGNQEGSLRITQIGSNINHRHPKMNRFTSSKDLPSFK